MTDTVLASLGRVIWRLGTAHRIDMAAIFAVAGLDPDAMNEGVARYPLLALVDASGRLAQALGQAGFGLEAAQHFRLLDLQLFGVAFHASDTLLTALRRLDRFERLVNSGVDHELIESDTRVDFVFGSLACDPPVPGDFEDARVAVILELCRRAMDGALDPIEVRLPYPEPADRAPYFGFFRCPLVWGAPRSRLSFSIEDARRAFTTVNRDLALGSDRVLQRALAELDKDDVEARVRRAIIDALPSGAPREAQIARSLHMGARTLQRKLHERGTSFSRLLEQVRRELAAQYVADARVPVIEISYLLGFSEPSAFSRAFKRWTGASPAVFRERAC